MIYRGHGRWSKDHDQHKSTSQLKSLGHASYCTTYLDQDVNKSVEIEFSIFIHPQIYLAQIKCSKTWSPLFYAETTYLGSRATKRLVNYQTCPFIITITLSTSWFMLVLVQKTSFPTHPRVQYGNHGSLPPVVFHSMDLKTTDLDWITTIIINHKIV